jgi:hypothetical protein
MMNSKKLELRNKESIRNFGKGRNWAHGHSRVYRVGLVTAIRDQLPLCADDTRGLLWREHSLAVTDVSSCKDACGFKHFLLQQTGLVGDLLPWIHLSL